MLEHYSHIRIDAKRQALDAPDNLRRGGDAGNGNGKPANDAQIETIVEVADDLTSQSRHSLLLSGSPPSGKLLIPLERRDVRVVEGARLESDTGSRQSRRVRAKSVSLSLWTAGATAGDDEEDLPTPVSSVSLLEARGSTDVAMVLPGMPGDRARRIPPHRTRVSMSLPISWTPCPFCSPDPSRVFVESELVVRCPVS